MNATATTAADKKAKAYAGFGGRVFRVVKTGRSGLYWAAGKARGARAVFLDKLGPRHDRETMQKALDATAARMGWKAVEA